MSTSYAAVGSYSGVGSRLSGMESREETEELEEEGEEGEPMKLEPEEEEIAMATGSWGFLRCWLRKEDEFVAKGVGSG